MLARYRPAFQALSREEVAHVALRLLERGHLHIGDQSQTAIQLFDACHEHGMTQADVVLALAQDTTPVGVRCLERLVGQPLRRPRPPDVPAGKKPRSRHSVRDPRVITHIDKNPKKPGTACHKRYALYRIGRTVDQSIEAGLTRADIAHDSARGHIRLRNAR